MSGSYFVAPAHDSLANSLELELLAGDRVPWVFRDGLSRDHLSLLIQEVEGDGGNPDTLLRQRGTISLEPLLFRRKVCHALLQHRSPRGKGLFDGCRNQLAGVGILPRLEALGDRSER